MGSWRKKRSLPLSLLPGPGLGSPAPTSPIPPPLPPPWAMTAAGLAGGARAASKTGSTVSSAEDAEPAVLQPQHQRQDWNKQELLCQGQREPLDAGQARTSTLAIPTMPRPRAGGARAQEARRCSQGLCCVPPRANPGLQGLAAAAEVEPGKEEPLTRHRCIRRRRTCTRLAHAQ